MQADLFVYSIELSPFFFRLFFFSCAIARRYRASQWSLQRLEAYQRDTLRKEEEDELEGAKRGGGGGCSLVEAGEGRGGQATRKVQER